ncbi:MAG: HisA/HisF-related TIM barrel protein [Methylococcales bacterium]|nr:HisA/HisF-related TIM barrel protein [Methylococcales bacterium]MDD5754672.1 HisA/HisF-related TIM barrel protein [Methylococcales bacterium]
MNKIKLIPVIDLKSGVVVHAKHGQREQYQPIKSVLTLNADIYSVLHGFLQLHAFDTFYIADLDAITGQGSHVDLLQDVQNDFPKITFWVDAGYQKAQIFPPNYFPVLGSECFTDGNFYELANFEKRFVLSLDYGSNGEMLGTKKLFIQTEFWSENVIVMTLNRVGSSQGVDVDLLMKFKHKYLQNNFIAAGGVRSIDDVEQLKTFGIKRVLVASALHSGAITKADIAKL